MLQLLLYYSIYSGHQGFILNSTTSNIKANQARFFFASDFFTNGFLLHPLLGNWRLFEFGFEFEDIFAIFIDSPLSVFSGKLQMYEFCAETLACPSTVEVDTSRTIF
jgi:hypothetical protein